MNIVTRQQSATATRYQPPELSPRLRLAMDEAANPHPDAGAAPVPVHVRAEAEQALRRMDEYLRPATPDDWRRWLQPFGMLANAPSDRAGLDATLGIMAFAFHDLPAVALSTDAQREALRTLTFWPRPAELEPILRPAIRKLNAERDAIRRVIQSGEEAKRITLRSPEEIAAVRAKAAAAVADLRAIGAANTGKREAVKASSYNLAHHIAHLEQHVRAGTATGATKLRLEALRRMQEVGA